MSVPKKIPRVIGSTRTPRLGGYIASYTRSVLEPLAAGSNASLTTLDLKEHPLPIFDEPMHPAGRSQADPTPEYAHEHTRKWSATVRQFDAYVFFTPQYNGSLPASLKTALDALFYEWKGKPAGIVSYAGRGGAQSGSHLRVVVETLGMKSATASPAVPANAKTLASFAEKGEPRPEDLERWEEAKVKETIEAMFAEIVAGLNGPADD